MRRVSLGEICGAVVKLSPISHLQFRFKCAAQGFKFIGASLLNMGFYEQLKPLYIAGLKFGFARFIIHVHRFIYERCIRSIH